MGWVLAYMSNQESGRPDDLWRGVLRIDIEGTYLHLTLLIERGSIAMNRT